MKRNMKFYKIFLNSMLSLLNRCYLLILKMALLLRKFKNKLSRYVAFIEGRDEE